jgi:ferritin-like metal-binding protein YciE
MPWADFNPANDSRDPDPLVAGVLPTLTPNKTNPMKTLRTLFLAELADIYDAEKRICKALPKMAKAATCDDLKAAFTCHLEETKGHVAKLEQVFACFELKARVATCEATIGLLKEGEDMAEEFKGSPAINAALIAAAQKVEHYEMATYGTLHEWAELLENKEASSLLKEILKEEKKANKSLNELAHSKINAEAMVEVANAG